MHYNVPTDTTGVNALSYFQPLENKMHWNPNLSIRVIYSNSTV